MKNFTLIFVIVMAFTNCIPPGTSTLQNAEVKMPFNMEEFDKKFNLANDLALDDIVAWWTTDSIMAKKPTLLDSSLDKTWFVYEKDGKRFAFYGRYSEDKGVYHPKYSFKVNEKGNVKRLSNDVTEITLKYAEAVNTGKKRFKNILDSLQLDVRYNHYVRKNRDGLYDMWFFPGGAGNYCAYGLYVHIKIDSTRKNVTGYEITGNGLRYFEFEEKPYKIEIDNTFNQMPSLGNLFFIIMNRKYFESIIIRNQNSISSMIFSPKTKEWVWINSVR